MVHTSTSLTTWIKLSEHKMMTIFPTDLLTKVDPQVFTAKFGCGLEGAQSLVEAKTLTISKLITIMPPGTVDPRYVEYLDSSYKVSQCQLNNSQPVPLQQHDVHNGGPGHHCIGTSFHGSAPESFFAF